MKVTKMASNSGNSKKKYNNIYEIPDIVLDTNGDSDMDFDLDDSDSEDYDSEWEGEPGVTQNPSPVREKIASSPPPVPVAEDEEPPNVPEIDDHVTGRRRWGVHTRGSGAQFQARGRGQQRDAMDRAI